MIRRPSSDAAQSTPRLADRHGAALALVLAVMILATALLAIGTRSVVNAHRQQRRDERRAQVEWLVASGLQRAAAQLSRGDDYTGETWQIAAEELGGRDAALVVIRVEQSDDSVTQRIVLVRADYPEEPDRRARYSKSIVVDLERLRGEQTAEELAPSSSP